MPWFSDWHGGAFNTPPANFGYGPYSTNVSGLGSTPQVPLPTQTQAGAIAGNLPNLGALYALGGGVNRFQQGQAALGLETNLPGYKGLIGQSSENIASLLRGEVPHDVLAQLAQSAAERGIATGSPGSPNANAAYLRALGLTSLGLQQQGETELTGAIGRTPQAPPLDISKFLVTPAQQQEAAVANALYAAAPNPTAVAMANLRAAQAGLGAGLGSSRPAGVTMPTSFQSYQMPTGLPTGPTDMSYGGGAYTEPAPTAQENWQNWYDQTFGGASGYTPPMTGPSLADQDWSGALGAAGLTESGGIMEGPGYGDEYFSDLGG